MRGLEHGRVGADVGARRHAEPADEPRGEIGDDVAVQVGEHEHVVLLRALHEPHAHGVDEVLPRLDVRVVAGHLAEHGEEEPVA